MHIIYVQTFLCLHKDGEENIRLSESFEILAGTEQGYPMSPELFKIYIHDLSLKLNSLDDPNVPLLNEIPVTHLF